jgi:glycosyltransferase involved in cell wall biosynthesis
MTIHNGRSDNKLRILICLLYYLPHRTGMQLYIQRIAEELVRRGHEVTILAARHQLDLPRDEMVNGVRVIRLTAPPFPISRGMIMPAYPWASLALMWLHDVVSVHTPMLETALLAWMARLVKKPIVITHHGDLLLPKGFANRIIQNTMFAFYRILAGDAKRIIAYSQDYADHSYYLQPYKDKVSVVYPPITMPPPNLERAAQLRAQWSVNGGPVIGYAGRFVQEKRPDLLIRALETINREYPDARIVFVGEYKIAYENTWELYQPVIQQYEKQLIFLGKQTDMQFMSDFFAACDMIALTSDSECFALVQVEAMLSGTPVVMTNIPGGRVPVQVTGMGELAQPGDPQSIGEAILKVLRHRNQYIKPRDDIERAFSFKETVDQYEQHFRAAAQAGR